MVLFKPLLSASRGAEKRLWSRPSQIFYSTLVFFMAQGDRQQEGLETLKLINAASTALRLYPGDSAQVMTSIENAYLGTKSFIRNNQLLRFSFLNGGYYLNGEPVNNPTRERLQLLTFSDQLQKMELNELVLSQGLDRKTFKKVLSVFSATPEQIHKAGGNRSFIEQLELTQVFPEHYIAPGESADEKKQKQKVDRILKELSGGAVQPQFILYLIGRKKEENIKRALEQSFQSSDTSAHIIATATYSLLQILHKDHIVVIAPAFSKMLENIRTLLDENQYDEVSVKAAALLAPYLDECSVLMLICQEFSTSFGECFYNALVSTTNNETMTKVLEWIKGEQEKGAKKDGELSPQLQAVSQGYKKLLETPRGKEILTIGTTREVLQNIEQDHKEKRVQAGITALVKGDLRGLENPEVCRSLPATIEKLLSNEKESLAAAIIQNVVKALKEQDHEYRSQLAQVVGGVAEKLVQMERWGWLEKLTPVCLAWLRENEVADRSLEKHVLALQAMMTHAWQTNNSYLAEQILNVFYHIRSGALEKSDAVRKVIGHIQDKNVDKALLQAYLDRCFVRPVDEMICWKIIMQGPIAAKFLLDTLITSEKRADRIRLLKILSETGDNLVPVLLERLPDPMPWYGKRNIIRLLAATGSQKDVEAVLSYIGHDDLRVQQETLQCIVRIGKTSTENYLLQTLPLASAQVKAQVVKNLRRVATEAVVDPLSDLLEECRLYSGSEKTELALEISKTLGASGTAKAFPVLQRILDGGEKQYGKESVEAAELGIAFIQEQGHGQNQLPEVQSNVQEGMKSVASTAGSVVSHECITDDSAEKEVYQLLGNDKKEAAKKTLLNLIEKMARLKKFNEAEALRLRLIDIDAMALTEIIKAAEIIEEAKSHSVDQDHILIWSDLYDLLSTEEFNAFYHALEHKSYPIETVIVKQGDPQWRLFFVNKGRVKLFFHEKESEMLVKIVGHGNVFGGASFFDASLWTLSATSMGGVELSTLSMDQVDEWGEVYPALEAKLQEYCMRFDRVNDFFLTSGAERREDERHSLAGSVHICLLDDEGKATDTTTRGDCSDISLGGISFLSRITKRKQARTLLGRHVEVFFNGEAQGRREKRLTGTVVAVRNLHSLELGRSVHVRFETMLEQSQLMDIINGN